MSSFRQFQAHALGCALTLAACSDNIATCPVGTLRRGLQCFERADAGGSNGGGNNGGASSSDANGVSNGETTQGQSEAGLDAGPMDAGAMDAALNDASSDTGVSPMADAQVDASTPCVPSVPSTEICNGIDDDCNGKTDDGMLVVSPASTTQWDLPTPMSATAERGLSALLPREGGGAYFLYKLLAAADAASSLSVVRFDQDGAVIAFPPAAPQPNQTQTGLLPSARTFLAASYGKYLAMTYFESDGDGRTDEAAGFTRLGLWREDATDGLLKPVSTPVQLLDYNADMAALSVIAGPAGTLRIVAAYSTANDNSVSGTGSMSPPVLHVFEYAAGGATLVPVAPPVELLRPVSGMPNVLAGATVRIVPDPCAAGWLVGYFDPPSTGSIVAERQTYLRRLSAEGSLGSVIWSSGNGYTFQGLGIDGKCVANTSRVLVVLGTASTEEARELLWTRDSTGVTAGSALETGTTPLVTPNPVTFTQVLNQRGVWFLTYRTFGDVRGLWELDVATDTLRDLVLPVDPGPLSSIGMDVRDTNMYFVPTQSLVPLSRGPFVTFSNASSNKTVDATANPLGSETAAITYQLGCP